MQLTTFYSSQAVIFEDRDAYAFEGWINDVNNVEYPWFRSVPIIPADVYSYSRKVSTSTINTSKSKNSFRDHDCVHGRVDGFLSRDITTCSLTSVPQQVIPSKYRRGKWSYLDYYLPPQMSDGMTLVPLNQDFYLNYWYPDNWDKPDSRPKNWYTNHDMSHMITVRSVILDGIPIMYRSTIKFKYVSNHYHTIFNNVAIASFLDSSGKPYTQIMSIRGVDVDGRSTAKPLFTGIEAEYQSMLHGELPFSLDDFSETVRQLKELTDQGRRACRSGVPLHQSDVGSPLSDLQISDRLDDFIQSKVLKVSYPNILEFWQLAELAIQDCKTVGINSIDFLRDLPDFGQDIFQIFQTVTKLSSKKKAIKALAKQFLALNYGSRLTISDIQELRKSINRAQTMSEWDKGYSKVHARSRCSGISPDKSVTSSLERCYKVYYRPNDARLCKIMKGLNDIGIYPTGENLWDLVPFSFVVDWFVNIGDVLSSVDTSNYCIYLDILSCVYSEKYVTTISDCRCVPGFTGDVTITSYHRNVRSKLHQPKLDLRLQNKFVNHIVELSAIAVSRHR